MLEGVRHIQVSKSVLWEEESQTAGERVRVCVWGRGVVWQPGRGTEPGRGHAEAGLPAPNPLGHCPPRPDHEVRGSGRPARGRRGQSPPTPPRVPSEARRRDGPRSAAPGGRRQAPPSSTDALHESAPRRRPAAAAPCAAPAPARPPRPPPSLAHPRAPLGRRRACRRLPLARPLAPLPAAASPAQPPALGAGRNLPSPGRAPGAASRRGAPVTEGPRDPSAAALANLPRGSSSPPQRAHVCGRGRGPSAQTAPVAPSRGPQAVS